MKERPILFSAPMVRAILDGRKTQTRRVVKGGELASVPFDSVPSEEIESLELQGWRELVKGHLFPPCPYGQPGDRLWVRETFSPYISHSCWEDACDCEDLFVNYPADGSEKFIGYIDTDWAFPKKHKAGNYIPSIHMPRWASRITLEITNVPVERLQDIIRGDALAEGCPFPNMASGPDPRQWFSELWSSIYGPESWAANPWVWAIELKRVQQ